MLYSELKNSRYNGLRFSDVTIERIIRNKFNAKVFFGKDPSMRPMELNMAGTSYIDALEKVERFLEVKLVHTEFAVVKKEAKKSK